jgi:hypothetical protein
VPFTAAADGYFLYAFVIIIKIINSSASAVALGAFFYMLQSPTYLLGGSVFMDLETI